jgi:hypothetical protein
MGTIAAICIQFNYVNGNHSYKAFWNFIIYLKFSLCIVGNSYGCDDNNNCCVGCGPQEQLYGCSDIAINYVNGNHSYKAFSKEHTITLSVQLVDSYDN